MVIAPVEMLLRMGTGAILGGIIGFERERSGHAAGLRTHLLVALASTLFMLVSTQFYYFQGYARGDLIATDPSRIAASVVTGVGFLGAGAILRTGINIQGLTTAASLWLVAALGLAAGGGMYFEASTGTACSLFALIVLRRVEDKRARLLQRRLEIDMDDEPDARPKILEELRAPGVELSEVEFQRNVRTREASMTVIVHFPSESTLENILTRMESLPMLRGLKVCQVAR
jgi:putative Mg2+ transporter-C (MgtC) family protein